ncbi:hypothetical protein [Kiloniella laminariae]|uniref:hypothetical protein n=1 Tax=Kiloniella laminariae TaxID=454162 RepID=UPI000360947B|nr:hypothetical protein [Kiloniella laminariae]
MPSTPVKPTLCLRLGLGCFSALLGIIAQLLSKNPGFLQQWINYGLSPSLPLVIYVLLTTIGGVYLLRLIRLRYFTLPSFVYQTPFRKTGHILSWGACLFGLLLAISLSIFIYGEPSSYHYSLQRSFFNRIPLIGLGAGFFILPAFVQPGGYKYSLLGRFWSLLFQPYQQPETVEVFDKARYRPLVAIEGAVFAASFAAIFLSSYLALYALYQQQKNAAALPSSPNLVDIIFWQNHYHSLGKFLIFVLLLMLFSWASHAMLYVRQKKTDIETAPSFIASTLRHRCLLSRKNIPVWMKLLASISTGIIAYGFADDRVIEEKNIVFLIPTFIVGMMASYIVQPLFFSRKIWHPLYAFMGGALTAIFASSLILSADMLRGATFGGYFFLNTLVLITFSIIASLPSGLAGGFAGLLLDRGHYILRRKKIRVKITSPLPTSKRIKFALWEKLLASSFTGGFAVITIREFPFQQMEFPFLIGGFVAGYFVLPRFFSREHWQFFRAFFGGTLMAIVSGTIAWVLMATLSDGEAPWSFLVSMYTSYFALDFFLPLTLIGGIAALMLDGFLYYIRHRKIRFTKAPPAPQSNHDL